MEDDVIDALQDVRYNGPILEEGGLEKALEGSVKSPEFRKAVVWLTAELKTLCKLDEQVNDISSTEDTALILIELSSFLKEIGCQYKFLTEGHISERLQSKKDVLLLLQYLVRELQSARMLALKRPIVSSAMEIKLQETSTASELKSILIALKFPKPPNNIQPSQLFEKVEQKMKEVVSRAPPGLLSQPLLKGVLTDKQWQTLDKIQKDLHEEYFLRRNMLIKRLDVTVQSFQWSDRVKHKSEEIANAMSKKRKAMSLDPNVDLSSLLAAREDLAIIEKTSSASVRRNTRSELNKVIIGQVPDRGGRTSDQGPPPPEMPSWQKDRNPAVGGRGGGRGGGGGGGGGRGRGDRNRVQGGWNQGSNDRGQGGRGQGDRNPSRNDRGGWNRGGQDRDQTQGGGWSHGDRKGGSYRDHRHHDEGNHYGSRHQGSGGGRRDNNYT